MADVAASFQEAVCDVLTAKAIDACREHGVDTLVIGGGVAANSRLRALAAAALRRAGITLRVPRPKLCTDNGAMVAALGAQLVAAGRAGQPAGPPRRLGDADHHGVALIGRVAVLIVNGGTTLIVRMWEVRAQQRNFTELLTWVCDVALPAIEVSPLHIASEVFTSTGLPARGDLHVAQQPRAVPEPPADLITRPPHSWDFSPVDR